MTPAHSAAVAAAVDVAAVDVAAAAADVAAAAADVAAAAAGVAARLAFGPFGRRNALAVLVPARE